MADYVGKGHVHDKIKMSGDVYLMTFDVQIELSDNTNSIEDSVKIDRSRGFPSTSSISSENDIG